MSKTAAVFVEAGVNLRQFSPVSTLWPFDEYRANQAKPRKGLVHVN